MPTATANSTAGALNEGTEGKGTEIIRTFIHTLEPTQSVEFNNSNDNDNINININKEETLPLDLETTTDKDTAELLLSLSRMK
jgi:hypothetical protein